MYNTAKYFNMKKSIIQLLSGALLLTLVACEKEENKVYYKGGTAPVLTANKTGVLPMAYADGDKEAVGLTWTNPNYDFNTGLSSHSVTYTLEVDTTGANFTNPKKKELPILSDLGKSITQFELNDYMLNQLGLRAEVPHNIEMRVKSTIAGSVATALYSGTLKFTATPFVTPPKVPVPTAGTLWMTGDAAKSGWSNPLPAPYDLNQKFTKIDNTTYQLTVALPGGGGYKLIQEQGNWGTQYHMLAGGTWEGGDFEKKDADPQFPGPPAAGTYKITVNFQSGKFTVVKQ